MELDCDQSSALVAAEVQMGYDREEILAEVRSCLDEVKSLPCSSHEMFRNDVNGALNNELRPLFDIVGDCIAAFCCVSSGQFETRGEALPQSLFSIISSPNQRLSSSTVVNHLGSTTSSPVHPDGLFSAWICRLVSLSLMPYHTVNLASPLPVFGPLLVFIFNIVIPAVCRAVIIIGLVVVTDIVIAMAVYIVFISDVIIGYVVGMTIFVPVCEVVLTCWVLFPSTLVLLSWLYLLLSC